MTGGAVFACGGQPEDDAGVDVGGAARSSAVRQYATVIAVPGQALMTRFRYHTSHVTRHTSHVTRHTSHVTGHTSHVTRHTSHVTRHTSHVTRHTSHVTRHTSQ